MSSPPATTDALVATVGADGEAARIVLSGRLDRDGEAAMAEAYRTAAATDPATVELDFGSVGYINSTGIALVVRLLGDAKRDGRSVRARGLTDHYREIFTITRLSDLMTIVEDDGGQR